MRKIFINLAIAVISILATTSCATIVGGSRYYAHVVVPGRPYAKIHYNGEWKGTGTASFRVNRRDANKVSLLIKEEGWQDQNFNYTTRSFRGGALVGTILTWTGVIYGLPIPWGVIVDCSTGALWKPNVHEPGVVKEDYKNFRYIIPNTAAPLLASDKGSQFEDYLYLKNGKIINGIILERNAETGIKIRRRDGIINYYKEYEIERITREEITKF